MNFDTVNDLREVGPPPNAKRRQNSLNRLCSVCAGLCCKKFRLCCFGFLDIKIIFIGHSEVTQPPHILQIHPKYSRLFVLRLCWFVPVVFFVFTTVFFNNTVK